MEKHICAGCFDTEEILHLCIGCQKCYCDWCFDKVTNICWSCLDDLEEKEEKRLDKK